VISTAFKATVRLDRQESDAVNGDKPPASTGPILEAPDVYEVYFHGPAYQVLGSAWGNGSGMVIGQMADSLPANHEPVNRPLTIAPRLIELCFQTAGMYELGVDDRFGLPSRISRIQRFQDVDPSAMPFFSVVRHNENGHGFDAQVVDQSGEVYMQLSNYRTAELPGAVNGLNTEPIKAVFRSA